MAVLIALVWGIVTLWPSGSDDEQVPRVRTTTETTPTPEPAPTVGAQESVDLTIAAGTEPCDPEQVRITPVVPDGQRVGEAVAVDLLVSTTQEQACTLTPGDADVVAVVRDGGTAVWDSSVCGADMIESPVGLSPQWATVVASGWSGQGSGYGCSDDEGSVSPGTYRLQIGTLGGEPGQVRFELAPKAEESEDDQPDPAESDSTTDETEEPEEGEDAG